MFMNVFSTFLAVIVLSSPVIIAVVSTYLKIKNQPTE